MEPEDQDQTQDTVVGAGSDESQPSREERPAWLADAFGEFAKSLKAELRAELTPAEPAEAPDKEAQETPQYLTAKEHRELSKVLRLADDLPEVSRTKVEALIDGGAIGHALALAEAVKEALPAKQPPTDPASMPGKGSAPRHPRTRSELVGLRSSNPKRFAALMADGSFDLSKLPE